MAKLGGAALRIFETVLYALTFCCAGIILGFYSYFLAVLSDRNAPMSNSAKAVEGISGAAVLFLIFAIVLTCFLGGIRFFAFLAIALDILFAAGFIAIAVLTRDGVRSCTGDDVRSPLGNGNANSRGSFGSNGFGTGENENVTYSVSVGTACNYNKVCFAVAIIGAFLFIISAIMQLWLGRHHQREKRYGPSPDNNYKSGKFNGFFKRRPKTTHGARDAELAREKNVAMRPSHEANYVETTHATHATHATPAGGYNSHPTTAGGYHTHPTGASVNPYGYDTTRSAPTRNAATNY